MSARLRVMLVHFDDPQRLAASIPDHQLPEDLPWVARITSSPSEAQATAARLREAGGTVIIVEEPADQSPGAFCPAHPDRLATGRCERCQAPLCQECARAADGAPICPSCLSQHPSPRHLLRLRRLFALFIFAIFLLLVTRYLRADRAQVDPTGTVEAVLLQFVPPGHTDDPIVRQLNGLHDPTLHELGPWFDAERNRYGGHSAGRYLDLHVRGPWPREVQPPPLPTPQANPLQAAWMSWRYARYFPGLAMDQGVDLDRFGVRIFVLYGAERGDLAALSRASAKGRVAIVHVSLDEHNPAYALLTIAHELAHTLGALDHYDPATSLARYPDGYVEPHSVPLYPQRFAALMAGDVPTSPTTEREIRSLAEVHIAYQSAAEMRWITEAKAEAFYTPPALSPEDRLPPGSAERPAATRSAP